MVRHLYPIGLALISLVLVGVASGCSNEPTTDSETHWQSALDACDSSSDCDDGLSCRCGVCSRECSTSDDQCAELGSEAVCASEDQSLAEHCASTLSGNGLCLEVCESDEDCAPRGDSLVCVDGYCMADEEEEEPEPVPTRPDADGVFAPLDGPPGITVNFVLDGVAYGHSSANAAIREGAVEWRSADGGRTWQPLGDTGVDTALEEASRAWYADAGEFRVLGTNAGFYRAAAGSDDFEALEHDFEGTIEKLGSTGEVLVAQANLQGVKSLYRSEDAGQSWTLLETPNTGVMGFDTWNGKIFVQTFSSYEISDDHGDSWQEHPAPPGGLAVSGKWWAKTDEALYLYVRGGASADFYLASSPDGITWTQHDLTGEPEGNLSGFIAVGSELYGMSNSGELLRIPKVGGQVEVVVAEAQTLGTITDIFAVDGALLLTSGGGSLRWADGQSTYEVVEGGLAHPGQLKFVDGELWSHTYHAVYRHDEELGWERMAPPAASHGWGNSTLFRLDGELYIADAADCLFRRSEGEWEPLFQWDTTIRRGCPDGSGGFGVLSALVSFDDAIYVGQTGSILTGTHNTGTRPVEGGLARFATGDQTPELIEPVGVTLNHAPHIMQMQRHEETLFVTVRELQGDNDIVTTTFQITDTGWIDVSDRLVETDGSEPEEASFDRLLDTDTGVYALVRSTQQEAVAFRFATWDAELASFRMLPRLPGERDQSQNALAAAAETLYAAVDNQVFRLEDDQWTAVGTGLPEDKGPVTTIDVDGPYLYVHLKHGGVWKLGAAQ